MARASNERPEHFKAKVKKKRKAAFPHDISTYHECSLLPMFSSQENFQLYRHFYNETEDEKAQPR